MDQPDTVPGTVPGTVLITGVSSGIGHALARRYLDSGARVLGTSRREPGDLLSREGFAFRPVDLGRFDAIGPVLGALVPAGTPLDLVVLNAGILGEIRDLSETPVEDLMALVGVNLWANKVILDHLLPPRHTIHQVVAVSSGASVSFPRGWGGYALSKAGLNGLIRLYAAEYPGVHFTSLAPGLVDTAMQETIRGVSARDRFPSLARLVAARGTPEMPDPLTAAARLIDVFPRLLAYESGSFVDVRTMGSTA